MVNNDNTCENEGCEVHWTAMSDTRVIFTSMVALFGGEILTLSTGTSAVTLYDVHTAHLYILEWKWRETGSSLELETKKEFHNPPNMLSRKIY